MNNNGYRTITFERTQKDLIIDSLYELADRLDDIIGKVTEDELEDVTAEIIILDDIITDLEYDHDSES